ncbi:FAD:protein FMN transferase [Candidatus Erwinia haradaeae]|uniref:FAD:protein FMN transferase n=1 Tax=Candidatus Erwinia haradaeae TaxID=1922217 RepID=A0A451D533_9GAMM|nr:FAD:protein FMN transferase [Candidatus Erwinia haradaeae]VFP80811.1 FAD:protein FMN transferase [Candidatus Erwinia haradaeae]
MHKTWQFIISCILMCISISINNFPYILDNQEIILKGYTMGTTWKIIFPGINPIKKNLIKHYIQNILNHDEKKLSTWRSDSEITKFNQYHGDYPQPISIEIADTITQALRIGHQMYGAMDITIGQLVNLWGFGPIGKRNKIPTQFQIDRALSLTGLSHLQVINCSNQSYLYKNLSKLLVDLSSVGEGFAVDHLASVIEKEGIKNYLVSVGGAIRTRGHNTKGKFWRIAIQKPTDLENIVQDIVILSGKSISTSGTYRNYYELGKKRLTHLINPTTGKPIKNHLVSVSVISNSALEADCWDSGLLILDMEKAQELAKKYKKAVYLIAQNGNTFTTWVSPQFLSFLPCQFSPIPQ